MAETVFVGNLVAEPEVRQTREGKPWAAFTLVHSARVRDQSGNWVDGDATYLDCVTFEHGAGNLAGVEKGTRIIAVGELKQQNWEKDGQKRSKIQLTVKEVGVSTRFGTVAFTKAPQGGHSASSAPQAGGSSSGAQFGAQGADQWANPGQSFQTAEAPF